MTDHVTRRVLMMCYFFPPIHSVGAHRSVGFATNLKAFGWAPVVLTVQRSKISWERSGAPVPADLDIVRSVELNLHGVVALCDAVLHRMFRLIGWRATPSFVRRAVCLPDAQIAWLCLPAAVRLARAADCVYVSCPPFSAAVMGAVVAKICRKPLILDFRDPWLDSGLRHRMERWALSHADALVLNTPGALAFYAERFPALRTRMICIPNGIDPAARPLPPSLETKTFTVMHVGEFFGTRQPDMLLEVMAELNNPDMEFVQVGPTCPALERYASRVRIRHIDVVPREKALDLMQTASLLYLKTHANLYGAITVPAKAYEYVASGIPILAECQAGDTERFLNDYGTRPEVVVSGAQSDLAAALVRAYSRRHEGTGTVDSRFLQRFDRKHLTGQLASVLSQAVGAGDTRLPPAASP